MVPLPRDEYIGQVDYWLPFVILSPPFILALQITILLLWQNPPLLPLQRPPFGDPATHKAHLRI
jgi:hypothetical protein